MSRGISGESDIDRVITGLTRKTIIDKDRVASDTPHNHGGLSLFMRSLSNGGFHTW
jgi:hypothetical protein